MSTIFAILCIPLAVTSHDGFTQREAVFLDRFLKEQVSDARLSVPYTGYGVTDNQVRVLSDAVARRVARPDLDHDPSRSSEDLVRLIRQGVNEVTDSLSSKPNLVLQERLRIEGVLSWVRLHFKYNKAIGDSTLPRQVRSRFWYTKDILSMSEPQAVCNGFARTGLDLVRLAYRDLRLKAHLVNGSSRPFLPTRPFTPVSDHSWLVVEQSDGYPLFADLVKSNCGLATARTLQRTLHSPWCLPVGPRENALFLASDMAMDYDGRQELPPSLRYMSVTASQWAKINAYEIENLVRSGLELSKTAYIDRIPR